jgi:hypothetical protein
MGKDLHEYRGHRLVDKQVTLVIFSSFSTVT